MIDFSSGIEIGSFFLFFVYGVLIVIYLAVLKAFVDCLGQFMTKHHTPHHRSVVDLGIRQEAANRHADDKTHIFDPFQLAITILKLFSIFGGIMAAFVIITLKFNVFFAFGVTALVALIVWQFINWQHGNRGRIIVRKYEKTIVQMGGHSVGAMILLFIALSLITLGLILLP